MEDRVKIFLDFFNNINTTVLRITVTLVCMFITTVFYVCIHSNHYFPGTSTGDWVPSTEWLGFLVVMSGIDAAQFIGKRWTTITSDGQTIGAKIKDGTISEARNNTVANATISSVTPQK